MGPDGSRYAATRVPVRSEGGYGNIYVTIGHAALTLRTLLNKRVSKRGYKPATEHDYFRLPPFAFRLRGGTPEGMKVGTIGSRLLPSPSLRGVTER